MARSAASTPDAGARVIAFLDLLQVRRRYLHTAEPIQELLDKVRRYPPAKLRALASLVEAKNPRRAFRQLEKDVFGVCRGRTVDPMGRPYGKVLTDLLEQIWRSR